MPLAFTSQGRRRLELDQIGQQNLAQIEARKQADLALQNNLLLQERSRADLERVYRQKEIIESFKRVAINNGATPEQAEQVAQAQYAQYIASHPEAETQQNLASSALHKENLARTGGRYPRAAIAGQEEIGAEIANIQAARAEAENRTAVARARATSAPELASQLDFEGIERAQLGRILSSGMRKFAPELAETEARSGIAQNRGNIARNVYDTSVIEKFDPALGVQAHEAGLGAARDKAKLISASGGLIGGDVPLVNDPYAVSPIMVPLLQRLISSGITNRASPNPAALPQRRLLNLNQLGDPRRNQGF